VAEAIALYRGCVKDLLLGSDPVLLVLVGFTTTAFIQLIVRIGLDHGQPLGAVDLRGTYFRWRLT